MGFDVEAAEALKVVQITSSRVSTLRSLTVSLTIFIEYSKDTTIPPLEATRSRMQHPFKRDECSILDQLNSSVDWTVGGHEGNGPWNETFRRHQKQ